jgi:prevent-host-death family protein
VLSFAPAGPEPTAPEGEPFPSEGVASASVRYVSVTDIRAALVYFLDTITKAAADADPVVITRHGRPLGVLISFAQFDEYRALVAARPPEQD